MIASLIALPLIITLLYLKRRCSREKQKQDEMISTLCEGVIIFERTPRLNPAAKKMIARQAALLEKCRALSLKSKKQNRPVTDSDPGLKLDLIAYPDYVILQDTAGEEKIVEMGRDFVANASH